VGIWGLGFYRFDPRPLVCAAGLLVGVSAVGMMGEDKCVVWECWMGVVRDPQARRGNRNPAPRWL
jgi:hypothetical protein